MNVAVMGHGTVGRSVVRLLENDPSICVKYILEIPEKCAEERMVSDPEIIFADAGIETVVDALPGVHPSFELIQRALSSGKNVVTSNKAALANDFRALLDLTAENGPKIWCEATCGGTIPVIKEAASLSRTNEITHCYGIMNGTTNFILDVMKKEGREFTDVLLEAQRLGYAEADPTADICGFDVKNKVILLSSICYHGMVTKDFPVFGIEKISKEILDSLAAEGKTVKLLGISVRKENRYAIGVVPVIFDVSSLEANVPRNFNMFTLGCTNAGDVKLYGQGAGGDPTADAVIRDLKDVQKGSGFDRSYFDRHLVYDPGLLKGEGIIDKEKVSGTLEELSGLACKKNAFFAFLPDFLK